MDFCAAFLVCGVKIMRIEYLLKLLKANSGGVTVYL